MSEKKSNAEKSGLETIPQIVKRPIYTDRIFWIGIATAIFWALVIWYVFFG